MVIKSIEFVQSVADWHNCPEPDLPEYAFIGRSNVGKSSLVNMIANRKSLAKTSSRPGKTQTINHFIVNNEWYLVDLPGYGYATTSKTMRENWIRMIENYLINRDNLQLVFVLIDARHEPQQNDIDFINNLGEMGMPFNILFTKIDKISNHKLSVNVEAFLNKLKETWEELPDYYQTSSKDNIGRKEILDCVEKINNTFIKKNNNTDN